MDAFKQHWRRPAQNFAKFTMSMVILTGALLATNLAVPAFQHMGAKGFDLSSGALAADVRDLLNSPVAYFTQRSPGARDSGRLIQSKHRVAPLGRSGDKPHERVLSNVRYAPPILPYVNDLVPNAGPGLIDFIGPGPAIGPGPIISFPPEVPPPVAPVVLPPTSNPGGLPGGNTGVPEPSTWFMMILGMALVGVGLRWQHRQLAQG